MRRAHIDSPIHLISDKGIAQRSLNYILPSGYKQIQGGGKWKLMAWSNLHY